MVDAELVATLERGSVEFGPEASSPPPHAANAATRTGIVKRAVGRTAGAYRFTISFEGDLIGHLSITATETGSRLSVQLVEETETD